MTQGRMTYDLRRLRLHQLIERIPHTHRYRVTDLGLRVALFFTRAHTRVIRPGLAQLCDPRICDPPTLRREFDRLDAAIHRLADNARIAA